MKMVWRGPQVSADVRAAAARGLHLASEHVLAESRRIVPIEEGTLARSGATDVDPKTLTATVSYDTPYAVVQHENTSYRHDAGRTAKYLEIPLVASSEVKDRIIAGEIRKVTGE